MNRRSDPGVQELRSLRAENLIGAALDGEVTAVLAMADRERRRPFEARAAAWVAQAKKDVDARFATIWGLDLGTTKQSAATPNSVVVISTTQSDNG